MVVIAANVTLETRELIDSIIYKSKFLKLSKETNLNLHDRTVLIRLAIINLIKHTPESDSVNQYKAALLRPSEFDCILKNVLGNKK